MGGERAGLVPTDPVGRARVNQVLLTVEDMVHEVNDTHHPLSVYQNYEEQKEAAIAKSRVFTAQRIPKFLGHLEETLRAARRRVHLRQLLSGGPRADAPDDGAELRLPQGDAGGRVPAAHRADAARARAAAHQGLPRLEPPRPQFSLYDNFRAYPELDLQA